MPKELAVLPKDFIGPPTPRQIYNAAPGVERETSLDTDGARNKTQEEYSVIKQIAVAQVTAQVEAQTEAKKKDKKVKVRSSRVSNSDFNNAKDTYDALSPEEKTAKYQAWQNGFLSDLDNAKVGDSYANGLGGTGSLSESQVDDLHGAADQLRKGGWVGQAPSNTDALADLLATKKDKYNSFQIPFWNIKSGHNRSVWDTFWQSDTSVGRVGYKDPDGMKDPNPLTTAYLVADGKQVKAGDFAQVTAPNGMSTWMRAMDANPRKGVAGNVAGDGRQAEMSSGAYEALGYKNGAAIAPPVDNVKVQAYPGSGGGGQIGYLTPAETQEAGGLIKDGVVKSISNKADLEKARKAKADKEAKEKAEKDAKEGKKTTSSAAPAGGIPILVAAKTVFAGQLQRQVGIASPTCIHEGGGYLAEGSNTVSVENCPLPRIGDRTSDDMFVVRGQGDVLSA
ncbi:Hypothetical protein A7982_07136 [Minicystis rosea]|nr:Hypothetical protein A7982_07136 [Minicystis rosea]